jgi:hypothetical protein
MIDEYPMIVLEGLEGNDPSHLKGMQIYIEPYLDNIIIFWWVVFITTLFIVSVKTFLNR